MTKKEKVSFVIEKLDQLYPEIPIPLDHTRRRNGAKSNAGPK